MNKVLQLIEVNKVPVNSMITVLVDGKKYLVAHTNKAFYVADDACTHAECSLGDYGFLEGANITCGCHGAVFDLTNGSATLPATKNITLYNSYIQNGFVCIDKIV
jgi:nitrite reductase/ring-hydroxylating ferredoxin subunit